MERLSPATPKVAPKKGEVQKPPKSKGPKETAPTAQENAKKKVESGKEAAHDFDMALAAMHSGDYESAAALIDKLRRSGQTDPTSYQMAIVQLGLLVQEGKLSALRQKSRSALKAFAQPVVREPSKVDRSV